MSRNVGKTPYLASAASAVIFGFSFLFTKNALDSLDLFQLLGMRFFLAFLLLQALSLLKVIKLELSGGKFKNLLPVALFQPVLYFIFETAGVALTSASEAGIIISLIPIAVAILAALILNEKLRPIQWLSVAASVGGVSLLTWATAQNNQGGHLLGIAALLGAVAAGSLYSVFSKKASSAATPLEVTYVMMCVGAVVFNVLGIFKFLLKSDLPAYFTPLRDPQAILAVLYLGLLSSVGAFFLMNYSLSKLEASQSSVFINLTPVVSVCAGVVLRGESFSLLQLLGSLIILAGVWGVNSPRRT